MDKMLKFFRAMANMIKILAVIVGGGVIITVIPLIGAKEYSVYIMQTIMGLAVFIYTAELGFCKNKLHILVFGENKQNSYQINQSEGGI